MTLPALYRCKPQLLEMRTELGRDLIKIHQDFKKMRPDMKKVLKCFDQWEGRLHASEDYAFEHHNPDEVKRVFEPLKSAKIKTLQLRDRKLLEKFLSDPDSGCLCPSQYRWIDPAKYPNPALLKAIQAKEIHIVYGIFISGPSGSGKTCAAWELIRNWVTPEETTKIFDRHGNIKFRPAVAITAKELKTLSGRVNQNSSDAIEEWEELTADSDQLLFIDDIGQVKFTAGFAENLFALIESVTNSGRPFICTAQVSGEELVNRWITEAPNTRDAAVAIMRRLNEHCTLIETEL